MDELLKKAERIGNALCGHTEKLVFSFADITPRVAANLKREGIRWQDWTMKNMEDFTAALARLNEKWGFDLATCAKAADLQRFGVSHNRCVDDTLIIRRAYADRELMNHLNVSIRRESSGLLCPVPLPAGAVRLENGLYAVRSKHLLDKGQREHCGCVKSKDIGEYNTCLHLCSYCYANAGERTVLTKYAEHRKKSGAESISGQCSPQQRKGMSVAVEGKLTTNELPDALIMEAQAISRALRTKLQGLLQSQVLRRSSP